MLPTCQNRFKQEISRIFRLAAFPPALACRESMTKSRFDHPFRTFTSSGLGETAKTQLWKAGAPRTIDARFPRTLLPILLLLALLAAPVQADQVTSYSQMVARLNRDAVQSPLIRIAALGKSSSGDRTVWMVRLA